MARYIDADELTDEIKSLSVMLGGKNVFKTAKESILRIIDEQPTADVVEVVRCKDCGMFVDNKEALVTYCKRECKNLTVNPSDFCSYGERRDT